MGGVQFSEILVNSKKNSFLLLFGVILDAFWSALADFLAKIEHQKASGRANLTKLDVKNTGLKKRRKMKGYGWSR